MTATVTGERVQADSFPILLIDHAFHAYGSRQTMRTFERIQEYHRPSTEDREWRITSVLPMLWNITRWVERTLTRVVLVVLPVQVAAPSDGDVQ